LSLSLSLSRARALSLAVVPPRSCHPHTPHCTAAQARHTPRPARSCDATTSHSPPCRPARWSSPSSLPSASSAPPRSSARVPTPATQQQFNPDRYLGLWYEMKTAAGGYEEGGKCGTASYAWNAGKTAVDVTNTNFVPAFAGNYTVKLIATPTDVNNGKFSVTFPPDSPRANTPPSMYWVLGTDYDTYSVVYSCSLDTSDPAALPSISIWVLARHPEKYNQDTKKTVDDLIKNNKLDNVQLQEVEHNCPATDCKPCQAVDIDVSKLAGRWWELQHSLYADNSDNKSCPYAEFSATDDGVSMGVNAIDYWLDGTVGKDLPKDLKCKWFDDNNKKKAEFNIMGGDANDRLCIIDTDYDNWAVLTVCVKQQKSSNIPPILSPDVTPTPGGGVFVLGRAHGLNADHQMKANKAVVTAGWSPAAMVPTPSTPCPASAFTPSPSPSGVRRAHPRAAAAPRRGRQRPPAPTLGRPPPRSAWPHLAPAGRGSGLARG
ncbi:hypothetical protein KUF71_005470, partial [Frankliniella fusca]